MLERLMDSFAGMLLLIGGGAVLLVATLLAILMPASYYIDKANCRAFERETTYDTKFVKYTPISWECLAKQPNGRWIPVDRLREID